MAKKYALILISLIVVVLLITGIVVELGKSRKELLSEVAEKQKIADMIPVWLKTNHDIIKMQDDLNTLAEYRVKNGCVADTIDQSFDCEGYNQRFNSLQAKFQDTIHTMELRAKSPETIAKATANIKDLAENQTLKVELKDIIDNPYSNNGRNVDIYEDNTGMEYLVDPAYFDIVQMGPAQGSSGNYRMKPQLTKDQLRKKAEAFLAKHVSDFDQVKNSGDYSYTETSKDGKMLAVRWDYKNKPEGEEMTPFVQVVLSPAGDVMSFNDTRSIYFVKAI